MSLSIEINGNRYKNFIDARVERSLEAAASSFSFTVSTSSDGTSSIPISQDSTIKIFADDQVILTGYIDSINPSYNISSHAIKFVGRSKTCDLVDCTIGSITEYKTTTLKVLCEAICSYFEIDVLDETTGVDTIEQVASPTAGQTAYKFLESFAKTRHVLLTDNELGNLLLTQSSSSLSSNIIKGIAGQNDNNIKSGSRVLDLSNIYGEYTVQSQLNPLDQAITTTPSVSSNQVGVSLETNARAVRKLEFYEAESSSSLTLQERADWERAIRRARGLYFSVVVQGHTQDDVLWENNLLYHVEDSFLDVNDKYLCKKIVYNYDLKGGSTTKMFFVEKDVYSLEATAPTLLKFDYRGF